MKKYILFIAIIFSSNSIFSQTVSFFAEYNYNSYSHESLKQFNREFLNDLTEIVPAQTVDEYPASQGFTLGVLINNITVYYSRMSTGAKVSYSDYSGVANVTQHLGGNLIGVSYNFEAYKRGNHEIKIPLKSGITFSNLDVESYSEVHGKIDKDSYKFKSIDLGLGVGVIYEYSISFFKLRASLGYDLVFGGKLKLNDKNHLVNDRNQIVRTEWSGFRTGLGIVLPVGN